MTVQHSGMNMSSHVLTSSCCLHFSEGHRNPFNVLSSRTSDAVRHTQSWQSVVATAPFP